MTALYIVLFSGKQQTFYSVKVSSTVIVIVVIVIVVVIF